jgi:hypothetical protein
MGLEQIISPKITTSKFIWHDKKGELFSKAFQIFYLSPLTRNEQVAGFSQVSY